MANRDDFSEKTKDLLAKRAGYRCSKPDCRRITIGANSDPKKSTNIGVASHICAAAIGGPRYDTTMTADQRKSPDNGIWLCQTCSVLIDKDTLQYSVDLLHEWKKMAEKKSMDDVNSFNYSDEFEAPMTTNTDVSMDAEMEFESFYSNLEEKSEILMDITALLAACRRANSWDGRSELKLYSWLNNHEEMELSSLKKEELTEIRISILEYLKIHIEMDLDIQKAVEDDTANNSIIYDFIRNHPGLTCIEISKANRITIEASEKALHELYSEQSIVSIDNAPSFLEKRWVRKF